MYHDSVSIDELTVPNLHAKWKAEDRGTDDEIQVGDIVQCRRMRDGEFDDYSVIKDPIDAKNAVWIVRNSYGDMRIIRRGLDTKTILES